MHISDCISVVCSSDVDIGLRRGPARLRVISGEDLAGRGRGLRRPGGGPFVLLPHLRDGKPRRVVAHHLLVAQNSRENGPRSEEHTSELQSLMRISYAVFCLKNKKKDRKNIQQ